MAAAYATAILNGQKAQLCLHLAMQKGAGHLLHVEMSKVGLDNGQPKYHQMIQVKTPL